ncbi:MAG: DNA mismatch repair endonuclease MutL [Bdellovibrionia bacterium]
MAIQVLDPDVVDQIAAGEVVERPSHLIKELIENSIDAGATRVDVEYSLGGRQCKISDNGVGMGPEDLPKALLRFATSKISKSEDIWRLNTFGFRGEALASISAVSRLTIVSKQKDQEQAYQLVSEFGQKSELNPVGGATGTTIWVEKLFENVPARLKFMKSEMAEHGAIRNTLKALAMAHYQVEFRVTENNKMLFFWPAAKSRVERAEQILEVKPLYFGEATRENIHAFAVFADPHNVAKTGKNIWLFAQNRWIQDRSMQAAVIEAYRNTLMHGEFPIAAVWVETDPEFIDVNIHPTKSQVKFHEPSLVFRAVAAAIRSTLETAPWLSDQEKKAQGAQTQIEPTPVPAFENITFHDTQLERTQFAKKEFPKTPAFETPQREQPVLISRESFRRSVQGEAPAPVRVSLEDLAKAAESREKLQQILISQSATKGYWSQLQVLGQANRTYIICQAADKLVFVDQHAAHERVVFEKLMSAWKGGKIDIQEYLFPLAVDLTPEKVEALIAMEPEIQRLGLSIEALGPSTVGVKAAPLIIKEASLSAVLDKMATECVEQGGSFILEKMIGDICATLACHSVVRAGQTLSQEQMEALLMEMDLFPLSSFCPHGRPVNVDYPFLKLEKDFGRVL